MVKRLDVVPVERWHLEHVAANIRTSDRLEVAALGMDPMTAVMQGYYLSKVCFSATLCGVPLCVFGVRRESWYWSTPWLLGTPEIEKHRRAFMTTSREQFAELLLDFPHQRNFVDDRNKRSIAWLQWLGFEMGEPFPFGIDGLPFRQFKKERGVACVGLLEHF